MQPWRYAPGRCYSRCWGRMSWQRAADCSSWLACWQQRQLLLPATLDANHNMAAAAIAISRTATTTGSVVSMCRPPCNQRQWQWQALSIIPHTICTSTIPTEAVVQAAQPTTPGMWI